VTPGNANQRNSLIGLVSPVSPYSSYFRGNRKEEREMGLVAAVKGIRVVDVWVGIKEAL
jgi:hypothetical protein